VRDYVKLGEGGKTDKFMALRVPRQCPLALAHLKDIINFGPHLKVNITCIHYKDQFIDAA
jgi:hypothetical protein